MPQAGLVGSFAEPAQLLRDTDLSPGQPYQPTQPSRNLGFIGRSSSSDLGAVGDNFGSSSLSHGGHRDQIYNQAMLEAAYYNLPQPKDSDRASSYIPVLYSFMLRFAYKSNSNSSICSYNDLMFVYYRGVLLTHLLAFLKYKRPS